MSKEFWFGSDADRAKAKKTLSEMRPKYERPKIGGDNSAPKMSRGESAANPTFKPGGGSPVNSVSRSEMDRMSERMRLKREGEARARKTDAATNNTAKIALNTDTSSSVPKFGGVGNYSSIGGKAPAPAAPKPKAKPAMPKAKPMASAAKAKAAAPMPKAKPMKSAASAGSGLKANWKGAAPTAIQARGGAKLKETSFQRTQRMQRDRGAGGR